MLCMSVLSAVVAFARSLLMNGGLSELRRRSLLSLSLSPLPSEGV